MVDLPSKKVISILVTVIVVTVLIIVFSRDNTNSNTGNIIINDKSNLTAVQLNDYDNDGLLDWEEDAWETDLELADTDGDGTSDGEEVRKGRHPLIVGPNDFVEEGSRESFLVEQKKVSDNFEEGTISDNLSKKLFSSYLTIKDDGSLGTQGEEDILKQIVVDASNEVTFTNQFSISNTKTFDSSNTIALTTYANQFAQLEIDKLTKLSQIPDENESLDVVLLINTNHADLLMGLVVPDDLVEEHLTVSNGYYIFAQALKNLEDSQKDPVKAVVSMGILEEIQETQNLSFNTIADFFRERGIIFDDNEPGILWDQY